jgi:hypothetical protein
MWWLLACAVSQEPETAPVVESWEAEGQLVVDGLERVESLLLQDQRESAHLLAERVYTDRWEPRLERASTLLDGPDAALRMEYAFGQLLWELSRTGPNQRVPPPALALDRITKLEAQVKDVAKRAQAAYPPPGKAAEAPPEPVGSAVVVPDVRPAWEQGGAAIAPVAGAKTEAEADVVEAKKSEKARKTASAGASKDKAKSPDTSSKGAKPRKDDKNR